MHHFHFIGFIVTAKAAHFFNIIPPTTQYGSNIFGLCKSITKSFVKKSLNSYLMVLKGMRRSIVDIPAGNPYKAVAF